VEGSPQSAAAADQPVVHFEVIGGDGEKFAG